MTKDEAEMLLAQLDKIERRAKQLFEDMRRAAGMDAAFRELDLATALDGIAGELDAERPVDPADLRAVAQQSRAAVGDWLTAEEVPS